MRARIRAGALTGLLLMSTSAHAQPAAPEDVFRTGNEHAAKGRFDEALLEYGRLERSGVSAPSLFWNWAQVASASGKKGETLWALLRARQLAPVDPSVRRETERVRLELGLDPAETSLGLVGDLALLARRNRFDVLALLCLILSLVLLALGKPRLGLSRILILAGALLALPYPLERWSDPRGVVVRKDAPLVDIPRADAVHLASLREGEVVPLLGEEGEYVKIQDASGARGFALRSDVRKIGMD